jgi:hypothetical protein
MIYWLMNYIVKNEVFEYYFLESNRIGGPIDEMWTFVQNKSNKQWLCRTADAAGFKSR